MTGNGRDPGDWEVAGGFLPWGRCRPAQPMRA
jgi:hypothetical protein